MAVESFMGSKRYYRPVPHDSSQKTELVTLMWSPPSILQSSRLSTIQLAAILCKETPGTSQLFSCFSASAPLAVPTESTRSTHIVVDGLLDAHSHCARIRWSTKLLVAFKRTYDQSTTWLQLESVSLICRRSSKQINAGFVHR